MGMEEGKLLMGEEASGVGGPRKFFLVYYEDEDYTKGAYITELAAILSSM